MAPLDFKHMTSAKYRPGEDDAINYYAQKRKKQYHGNEGKEVKELSMKPDKKLPNLKVPVKGKKGISRFTRKKAIGQAKDDINAAVQSADRRPEKYMKPDGKMGIRMVRTDKEVIKKEASVLKPTKPTDIIKHAKSLAKNPRDYTMNKKKYLDKARAKVFRMYPKEDVSEASLTVKDATGGMSSSDKKRHAQMVARHGAKTKYSGTDVSYHGTDSQIQKALHIHHPDKDDENRSLKYHKSGQHGKDYGSGATHTYREAINHDDAHRDAQQHSDGSMSVKKIPSMIKKSGDKHLHLHMKSYHKEKDGQDFAKKHGYKVKNYVKTPSGTRMDIHKEAKTFDYFDNRDDAHAHAKKHGGKVFVNTGKGNTKVKGKRINTHVVIKKEAVEYPHMMYDPKTGKEVKAKTPADHEKYAKMGYTHEKPKMDEALTLQQRMKRSRLMKRLKTRIKIGRDRARRKMANKKTLEKRSMRQARAQLAKKLTRGIPKAELTFARKKEIEKRLEKPALKQRIKRIAKRLFKDVRKKEVQRKKG